MQARVTLLGNLALYTLSRDQVMASLFDNKHHAAMTKKQEQKIHASIVVDNSGSMGLNTALCIEQFMSLVGSVAHTGTLIVFDSTATVLAKNFTNGPAQWKRTQIPPQGRTNLTDGIRAGVADVESCADINTLHLLIFLSDGHHNEGPQPTEYAFASQMGQSLRARGQRVAFLCVGVGAQHDTSVGMRAKAALETQPIPALETVYFANNFAELKETLIRVREGVAAAASSGASLQFSIAGTSGAAAVFLETNTATKSVFMSASADDVICLPVLLNGGGNSGNKTATASAAGDGVFLPTLCVNGHSVDIVTISAEPTEADISAAVRAMMPSLSVSLVAAAGGSVSTQAEKSRQKIQILQTMIDAADAALTAAEAKHAAAESARRGGDSGDNKKSSAAQRTRLLVKDARQSRQRFAEARNQLASLSAMSAVTAAANAADTAAFLNGAARGKFAAKALVRAADRAGAAPGDVVVTLASCLQNIKNSTLLAELSAAFEADKSLRAKHSSTENDERVGSSILSLQTSMEQVQDTLDLLTEISESSNSNRLTELYSLLVSISYLGVPINVAQTNAAQIAPLQTSVTHIECTLIDSGSLFLHKRTAQLGCSSLRGTNGKQFEFILPMCDPACPKSTARLLQQFGAENPVLGLVTSATICGDLNMAHPQQLLSLHVHSFVAACDRAVSGGGTAYLELAVRILYSIRKIANRRMTLAHQTLLHRWLVEEQLVTTSQDDNCEHTALLPFLLGVCDFASAGSAAVMSAQANMIAASKIASTSTISSGGGAATAAAAGMRQPIVNALLETMARRCKTMLARNAAARNNNNNNSSSSPTIGGTTSAVETTAVAHAILHRYFGITKANSPQPDIDNPMANEPAIEAVRESCLPYADARNQDALHAAFGTSATTMGAGGGDANDDDAAATVVAFGTREMWNALRVAIALQSFFCAAAYSSSSSSSSSAAEKEDGSNNDKARSWPAVEQALEETLQLPPELIRHMQKHPFLSTAASRDVIATVFMNPKQVATMMTTTTMTTTKPGAAAAAAASAPRVSSARHTVADTILAQCLLHHTSDTRAGVDEEDVADAATLRSMIVKLRLVHYLEAMQVKRERYFEMIGDVRYAEAISADGTRFASLLGAHTHGKSWQEFWSLLRACDGDDEKMAIFASKSNHSVKSSIAALISRAKRRRK